MFKKEKFDFNHIYVVPSLKKEKFDLKNLKKNHVDFSLNWRLKFMKRGARNLLQK